MTHTNNRRALEIMAPAGNFECTQPSREAPIQYISESRS